MKTFEKPSKLVDIIREHSNICSDQTSLAVIIKPPDRQKEHQAVEQTCFGFKDKWLKILTKKQFSYATRHDSSKSDGKKGRDSYTYICLDEMNHKSVKSPRARDQRY